MSVRAPLPTPPPGQPLGIVPHGSWLDRVPVIGLGVFNATASHLGSGAAMVAQIAAFPPLAPFAPALFHAVAAPMPSAADLWHRYLIALGFNLAVVTPLFTGLECLCAADKGTRAIWRARLHVDTIVHGAGRIWQQATQLPGVQMVDQALTRTFTRRTTLRVKDGAASARIALEVNYWGSFKQDVATAALYTKEFVMRGIAGVTGLLTRRMEGKIGWATKVKNALTARPLRRLLQTQAHRRAVGRVLTPTEVERFQYGTPEIQSAIVQTLVDRSSAAQQAVDTWMRDARIGHAMQRFDDILHFIGRVFPGTQGRVAGAGADLAGNVSTDVISADILGGGMTSLWGSVGPSMIVSVAGAYTNAGIAENTLRPGDLDPAGRWSFAQAYARRVALAAGRSSIFRSFRAADAATAWLTYSAQILVSLWSLAKADEWVRNSRAAAGVPSPDAAYDATPNVVVLRDVIARDLDRRMRNRR